MATSSVASAAMMFVRPETAAVVHELSKRASVSGPLDLADLTVSDYEGARVHIEVAKGDESAIQVDLRLPAFKDLQALGADAHLQSLYGSLLVAPKPGYDVSLRIDEAARAGLDATGVSHIALLRRHAIAAAFVPLFKALQAKSAAMKPPVVLRLRPEEPLYLVQRADRITVIYTLDFTDTTDRAIAKVVAQEFEDSSRRVAGGAPPASFSPLSAPQEIKDLVRPASARPASTVGWLSLSVFPTHLDTPAKFENAVTQLVMFRAFLDYHIKAAKSYLHMRMRNRIDAWLQVLNRAQPDEPFAAAGAPGSGAASPAGYGPVRAASGRF